MEDMMPLMTRATEQTASLVRAVRQEQLGLPTPCEKYDVKDLVNHLEWVAEMFASLARQEAPAEQGPYAGDFPERAERTLAAWSRPEAWEGVSPGMGMPMTSLAHMYLVDMVAHGWDLARATGQEYAPDPETVARALSFTEQMAEKGRQGGVFGPAVAVPDDASPLDRLLGVTGRDPAWTP
ncbi:TIGR03086 family metal-binding protein [Nonomuraea ferruginea]|uniref:TIGR03086 family metal-binding protein n=1 Tax=Nonomuraea ferruginea TaxID=46174 RepID=A0ABT4T812_9ACTN|nr:TIGR03086 family metal-binding protein [Nonomuraea ferruginea]MDA0645658.1 TIGR03086 family metal-binding protein [Nonomuraea ferruginea]